MPRSKSNDIKEEDVQVDCCSLSTNGGKLTARTSSRARQPRRTHSAPIHASLRDPKEHYDAEDVIEDGEDAVDAKYNVDADGNVVIDDAVSFDRGVTTIGMYDADEKTMGVDDLSTVAPSFLEDNATAQEGGAYEVTDPACGHNQNFASQGGRGGGGSRIKTTIMYGLSFAALMLATHLGAVMIDV